jgi:arabinogalactan endo-1,4-beta-galactosidase
LCKLKNKVLQFKILPVFLFLQITLQAQFYYGNDLSYVNQMEDCGAVFKENGQIKDVFHIFADLGTNLVRVRLWNDPSWWQDSLDQPAGVLPHYSDIEDVKTTIARAKSAGMQVMLDLHLSDFWADPGRQLIPRAWLDVAYDLEALKDSVYNYTFSVLADLEAEGLMPDIVKIGNESNGGILRHIPEPGGFEVQTTVSNSWSRHGQLWNAAIQAIRDVGESASINPKIAIHFTNDLDGQVWNFNNLINNGGVTDFDIMGISYYYGWHEGSITELQTTIEDIVAAFPAYEVIVAETGYPWSTQNYDQLGNIITTPDPEYLPVSPEKQLEYMVDYTHAVQKGGGKGVVFWEPAWVSTPCKTPWGTGSSHEHVAFFDTDDTDLIGNGAGRWTAPDWYVDPNAVKITFKVDMTGVDVSNGVFITGSFTGTPWQIRPMLHEGNNIYTTFTYLSPGTEGGYYFLNGNDFSDRETVPAACAFWQNTDRKYVIPDEAVVYDFTWSGCDPINPPDLPLVTFAVDMTGQDVSNGVYITGNLTGDPWQIQPATHLYDKVYTYSLTMNPGSEGAYYFLTTDNWSNYLEFRETVPPPCNVWWNSDRGYIIPTSDTVFAVVWGSCETFTLATGLPENAEEPFISAYPNPANDFILLSVTAEPNEYTIDIIDINGRIVREKETFNTKEGILLNVSTLISGIYFIRISTDGITYYKKIVH